MKVLSYFWWVVHGKNVYFDCIKWGLVLVLLIVHYQGRVIIMLLLIYMTRYKLLLEYSVYSMRRSDGIGVATLSRCSRKKICYYPLFLLYIFICKERESYTYMIDDDILGRLTPSRSWWLMTRLVRKIVWYMYYEGIYMWYVHVCECVRRIPCLWRRMWWPSLEY